MFCSLGASLGWNIIGNFFFTSQASIIYILDLNFSASNCHELLFKLRIHVQPGSYCGPVFVYMTDSMKFHTSTNNHTGIQVHPASSCTKWHKLIPVRLSYRYEFHTGTTFIWYEILGGDYMIPVRLSYRYEFNPVLIVAMFFFTWYQHEVSYQYESYQYEFIPVTVLERHDLGTTFIPVRDLACKHTPLTVQYIITFHNIM